MSEKDWIHAVQARGLTDALVLILDVLEPVGVLSAQVLWVMQPAAGVFGWRQAVGEIAHALEEPDGVERLRQRLNS